MVSGKDRYVLVDIERDENGSLIDVYEHEQTGERMRKVIASPDGSD